VTHLEDSSGFDRTVARLSLGNSAALRRAISPVTYIAPGAPPFLILHGRQDTEMPMRHSVELADRLRAAGDQVTLVLVDGAKHGLATPGQQPSPMQITNLVVGFLDGALGPESPAQHG
jgi:dipeptidyl aminopeptidase/acylaminoacyl peptidase